jgi:hypothetical protein
MNSEATTTSEASDPIRHQPGRWSRALTTTACVVVGLAGLAGCASDSKSATATLTAVTSIVPPVTIPVLTTAVTRAEAPPTTVPTTEPTTEPAPATTVVVAVEDDCRRGTAPVGTDDYGVVHTGEMICTWGPGLRAHITSEGFVGPSQNHPVDLDMAEQCWSDDGRVYLRTPAVEGWACIGGDL